MTNGGPDPNAALVRAIARLETAVANLARNVESTKSELRLIAPRLDTLVAEVRDARRLVHRQGNFIQVLATATDTKEDTTTEPPALPAEPKE